MDHGNPAEETSGVLPQYRLVGTKHDYRTMLRALAPCNRFAIDIEGDSLYHYYEKVCLIQVSTDAETYILDPLAIRNLEELSPIMRDDSIQKVFHAAAYDVSCLRRDYGFSFANLFDTHMAGQLLGYEQLGLSTLLERQLGVVHSKRRQRDDWSRRPLKPEQLEYAAMDTRYLLRLRDVLEEQLRKRNRFSWAKEEFSFIAEVKVHEKEFDPEGFRRIRGSRELSLPQLSALRALYEVRDRYAREMNVPPFRVLNNCILLDLARKPPSSERELFKRPGISWRVARHFSREIHRIISQAQSENPNLEPTNPRNIGGALSKEAKLRLEKLKRWRKSKSDELQLPVGVVIPGNLLEKLAAAPPPDESALLNVDGMRRWRVHEFGEEILEVLGVI